MSYQNLTAENYGTYFQEYVARYEVLPKEFCAYMHDQYNVSADYSPESLKTIWPLLKNEFQCQATYLDRSNLPLWGELKEQSADLGGQHNNNRWYSAHELWLIDRLETYFVQVFIRNVPDKFIITTFDENMDSETIDSMGFREPTIYWQQFLGNNVPIDIMFMYISACWYRTQRWSEDDLYSHYVRLNAAFDKPRRKEDIGRQGKYLYDHQKKVIVENGVEQSNNNDESADWDAEALEWNIEPHEGTGTFNFQLSIDESAEHVLGEERFSELAQTISAQEGIKQVVHEDREIFYLQSDLRLEQLKTTIGTILKQIT